MNGQRFIGSVLARGRVGAARCNFCRIERVALSTVGGEMPQEPPHRQFSFSILSHPELMRLLTERAEARRSFVAQRRAAALLPKGPAYFVPKRYRSRYNKEVRKADQEIMWYIEDHFLRPSASSLADVDNFVYHLYMRGCLTNGRKLEAESCLFHAVKARRNILSIDESLFSTSLGVFMQKNSGLEHTSAISE